MASPEDPPVELQPTSVLRIRRDVRYRVIDGEAVVLRQEAGEAMVLEEVGARILELLDGSRSLAQLIEQLHEEFDDPAGELESDCMEFAAALVRLGVVEPM